jgi:integrase
MKIVRKRVKKYALVSSHTARRTGATNMYLAGVQTFRIMLITGHTTEQSFFKYIRIEREENARVLSEHPFFKG